MLVVNLLIFTGPSQSQGHAQGQEVEEVHFAHWEATARGEDTLL